MVFDAISMVMAMETVKKMMMMMVETGQELVRFDHQLGNWEDSSVIVPINIRGCTYSLIDK